MATSSAENLFRSPNSGKTSSSTTSHIAEEIAEIEQSLTTAITHNAEAQKIQKLCDWQQCRGVLSVSPEHVSDSLMATTIAGYGKITVPPYVMISESTGLLLAFYHLGPKLSGHAGMCHGGVIAVLLDECMGRASFAKLPNRVGVTATLEIKYLAPLFLNNIVMVKASTIKVEGRRAWVEAEVVELVSGKTLTKAKALFIEPSGIIASVER
ncbi:hypothetical protein FQN57_005994 [Myotisia sp. PD_48]|nr:hypothetical protein FQN57_005994 [Myotisia sp. PD_48]